MVSRTPPGNYQRYLDSNKVEKGMENGEKELNVNERKKTDNNTSRTNSDQKDYNTRFIQANHNALFGYQPKGGYILPGRTLNAEKRHEFERTDKADKLDDNVKSDEDKIKQETDNNSYKNGGISPGDYSAVRRGVDSAQNRLNVLDNKVDVLDSGSRNIPYRVGEVETDMAARGQQVDDLQYRNKAVSAKIHALERELKEVQLENRTIKGQLLGPDYQRGYDPIPEQYGPSGGNTARYDEAPPQDRNGRYDFYADQAKERYVRGKDGPPERLAKNDQYSKNHVGRIVDEKGNSYYGLNKIYDQNSLTSYRNEQVPYLLNKAERDRQAEYDARKEAMQNRFLMNENKFFHNPSDRHPDPSLYPDEHMRHEPQKAAELHTTYGWNYGDYEHGRTGPSAGGLCLIRFHESSLPDINTAIHLLQRSLFVVRARVLGIAASRSVAVLQGAQGWRLSNKETRPQIQTGYRTVHDAVLAIWFPSREKASELFRSEANHNRFRGDPTFLNPYGYDTMYLQLNVAPPESLDTFLVLEIPNAKMYDAEKLEKERRQGVDDYNYRWFDLQNFEVESRKVMQDTVSHSMPNICAVTCTNINSIDGLKPGTIFKPGSRVFISAFAQLSELDEVWGKLESLLRAHKIERDVQAFAFSVKDMKEHFRTPHWDKQRLDDYKEGPLEYPQNRRY